MFLKIKPNKQKKKSKKQKNKRFSNLMRMWPNIKLLNNEK